jgi:large subunit ribosomal protein L13
METYIPRPGEVATKWYVVDAAGQVLGRLATQVATLLRGKHREEFTPFLDLGDHVIVVNAGRVQLTGSKWDQKVYRRFTGHPGGLREIGAQRLREEKPERVVREAVLGMLPKNKLGRKLGKKLLVYAGETHPHQAQKPEVFTFPKNNK